MKAESISRPPNWDTHLSVTFVNCDKIISPAEISIAPMESLFLQLLVDLRTPPHDAVSTIEFWEIATSTSPEEYVSPTTFSIVHFKNFTQREKLERNHAKFGYGLSNVTNVTSVKVSKAVRSIQFSFFSAKIHVLKRKKYATTFRFRRKVSKLTFHFQML